MKTISVPGPRAVACVLLYFITPLYAALPWLHVEGNKIKDPTGHTVVLRGISLIDLGFTEGRHGGVFPMIDRLTNQEDPQANSPGWYPRILRLPIDPPDSVTGYPYRWKAGDDSFYKDLLRPVVDSCAAKGLYVIVDWHYCTDTWTKAAQTSEFWREMAPRFAGDSHVLFELFNEPINNVGDSEQRWRSVKADMQTWVNIVRDAAPNNLILVGGPQWCQVLAPQATDPIVGRNIVYVAHVYPSHWLGNNSWIRNQIETCSTVAPVLMTEWGFTTTTERLLNGTITNYGRPLVDFLEGLGIGHIAWCASYDWGPPMFRRDWTLRCGEGEMGGFVKDTLYRKRDDDQPQGTASPSPGPGVLAVGASETNDSQALRVLFIGNSLTAGIRRTLDRLVAASPYSQSTLVYVVRGGWTLQQHLNDGATRSRIASSRWDYVVLQEQGQLSALPGKREQFHQAAAALITLIRQSGAKPVLYLTWGRRDGDTENPQINPDYETMQTHLTLAYDEAARKADALLVPVGEAWRTVRRERAPLGSQLYHSDGVHPSERGAYLAACVFYATLFKGKPTQLSFNDSLPADEAQYLRAVATQEVERTERDQGGGRE